jgi:hypothetical protein
MGRRNQVGNKIGEKWWRNNTGGIILEKIEQTSRHKHHKTEEKEKKENLRLPLPIGTIGSERGLWEGRQKERLIGRELFWWLTGRKNELGRVVERGEEMV